MFVDVFYLSHLAALGGKPDSVLVKLHATACIPELMALCLSSRCCGRGWITWLCDVPPAAVDNTVLALP